MVEIKQYIDAKTIKAGNEKALIELGINIMKEAKPNAPGPRTGALRNSLMYSTSTVRAGAFNDSTGEKAKSQIEVESKEGELFVGSALPYAVYQEFGTRYMPANPYLRPAIALAQGKSKDIVKRRIDEEIAKGKLTGKTKIRKIF